MALAIERYLDGLVMIAAFLTIPLTIDASRRALGSWADVLDWAVWLVFVLEAGVLFILLPRQRFLTRRRWMDLAIIIVSFPALPIGLAGIRLLRVLRLLRFVAIAIRVFPAFRSVMRRNGLVTVAGYTSLVIVFGGALFSVLEPNATKGGFWDGLWWATVTATTVGYGDISPQTPAGRILAVIVMVAGIGLTATLAATVAAHFIGEDRAGKERSVDHRLDAMEAQLRQLNERIGQLLEERR